MTRRLNAGFVPLVDAAPLIAAAERGFAASVAPVALVVDGHRDYSSPTALANTSSSVGTLGRRWRT